MDGIATLSLLPRGEDYKLTMPYAHCKGILMGTMTMELGGKVYIECSKTGYSAELEFKLRVRNYMIERYQRIVIIFEDLKLVFSTT